MTLLELMIAMTIMLAITSLAIPSFVGVLRRATLEETASQIGSVCVMAGAKAQREGDVFQLVVRQSDRSKRWLSIEPMASPDDGSGDTLFPTPMDEPGDQIGADGGEIGGLGPPVRSGQRSLTLPSGYEITDHVPVDDGAGDGIGSYPAGESPVLADEAGLESRPMVLAVFLPDGSAILGGPRYLVASRGGVLRLSINRWTGVVTFTPVARGTDVEEGDQDTLDENAEADGEFPSEREPAGEFEGGNGGGGGGGEGGGP